MLNGCSSLLLNKYLNEDCVWSDLRRYNYTEDKGMITEKEVKLFLNKYFLSQMNNILSLYPDLESHELDEALSLYLENAGTLRQFVVKVRGKRNENKF